MNKKLLAFLTIVSLAAAARAESISAALTLSYLAKSDSGFKEVYGSGGFQPGLRLEASVWKGLSFYGSYGYFAKTGATPVLAAEAKTTQHFMGVGAAWRGDLSRSLAWGVYAGLLYVRFQEEAIGEKIKDGAMGGELGALLDCRLSEKLFVFPFFSYLLADHTVEGVKVKLGGIKAGAGLGIRF